MKMIFGEICKMLGIRSRTDLGELLKKGAQVVDVRSPEEYATGCLKGSINIPLHDLNKSLSKIDKNKPVIVCCLSGMRSVSARVLLKERGFDVHNGGGWHDLRNQLM